MRDAVSAQAYRESLNGQIQRHFGQRVELAPEQWATDVYRLPNGKRFTWEFAPFQRGMFRAIFDPRNKSVNFRVFSRAGKTTCTLLAGGYFIDRKPRKILDMWPTIEDAEKFRKEQLNAELFDTTEPLNKYGTDAKRGGSTLTNIIYPGGPMTIIGANSFGAVRRAKASFLVAHEIDAIKGTMTDEGDILRTFWKRGDEFPDTIRVFESYPSWKGKSRIDKRIENSDCNEWYSTCVHCGGEPYVMSWDQLVYEEGKEKDARLVCPHCEGLIDEAQRVEMAHGQGFDNWRPRFQFEGHAGFIASSVLWPHPVDLVKYPGGYIQQAAESLTSAKRSENPRKALQGFWNMERAESYDPTAESEPPPAWKTICDRRENYTVIPEEALVLTCMADVQGNRVEVEWRAWAPDEQSWGLAHTIIDGSPRDPGTWQRGFATELQRKFPHASGAMMGLSMGFVDGGHFGEDIYTHFFQWLHRNRIEGVSGKIRATKGEGKHNHPIVDENWRAVSKNLKGHHLGTWEAKDLINHRLRLEKNGDGSFPAGFMHYNQNYGDIFFQQLCTAEVSIEYEGSDEVRKYLNVKKLKDEALDLAVGNLAAFRLRKHRWNFDSIRQQLMEDAAARAEGKAKAPKPPRMRTVSNPLAGLSAW